MLYLADVRFVKKRKLSDSSKNDSIIENNLIIPALKDSINSSVLSEPDIESNDSSAVRESVFDCQLAQKQEVLKGVFKNPKDLNWAW